MVPKQCVEWQSPYDTRAAFYKQIIIKASVLGENSNLGLDAVQLQTLQTLCLVRQVGSTLYL